MTEMAEIVGTLGQGGASSAGKRHGRSKECLQAQIGARTPSDLPTSAIRSRLAGSDAQGRPPGGRRRVTNGLYQVSDDHQRLGRNSLCARLPTTISPILELSDPYYERFG